MNAPFSTMGRPEPQIVVFTPAMRTLIADAIESLILLLDEIDGDVEHEEDADFENEPDMERSLGAMNSINQSMRGRAQAARSRSSGSACSSAGSGSSGASSSSP